MIDDKKIVVIIPAFNEEQSLPKVIYEIPDFVDEIIVANNGSTDNTAEIAKKVGATVVTEKERGYGAACLKAIDYIKIKTMKLLFFSTVITVIILKSCAILLNQSFKTILIWLLVQECWVKEKKEQCCLRLCLVIGLQLF